MVPLPDLPVSTPDVAVTYVLAVLGAPGNWKQIYRLGSLLLAVPFTDFSRVVPAPDSSTPLSLACFKPILAVTALQWCDSQVLGWFSS